VTPSPLRTGISLVLASQSPRRTDLLRQAGIPHTVRPAAIPEIHSPTESARDYVARLAGEKAAAVPAAPHEAVLAADTTVVVGDTILEKPADPADARRMLTLLSGRRHLVHTGVCLQFGTFHKVHVETTEVHFAPLTPAAIDAYLATGEPFGKAGAYAIQGVASRYIERIEGCYFNIVGLPVNLVWRLLDAAGLLA
jgi:septum formation protein